MKYEKVRQDHWKFSYTRQTWIVKHLKTGNKVIEHDCGYCLSHSGQEDELADRFNRSICKKKCSLSRDNLCGWGVLGTVFRKYFEAKERSDFETALHYAEKILTAIEADGREWGYIE